MRQASREVFLEMFFSNLEIISIGYVSENMVYKWMDEFGRVYYIVCPKTFSEYHEFKRNLEPLLQELV